MAAFAFRAYRQDGTLEAGVIEAADGREAARKLQQANKSPFALNKVDGTRATVLPTAQTSWWRLERRADISKFLADLSVLLDAGFNAAAALRVLASAEPSAGTKAQLSAVSDALASGRSLAQAFALLPGATPDIAALVASGEASGRIAAVVATLAESHKARAERRAAVRDALIYPGFLLFLVAAAILFLSLFLMPAIEPIFDSSEIEKPLIVWLLSGFGNAVRGDIMLWLGLAATLLALAAFAARRPSGHAFFVRILLRLPLFGRLRIQAAGARFLDALALLAGNGVPLNEALRLAALACPLEPVRAKLDRTRDRVAEGERLQPALATIGLFDEPTLMLVGLGEESNNLGAMLKRAATLIETRQKVLLDRLITFLTPAVTIALGLLIGTLVVSVMTALLSMNQAAIQ